MLEQTQQQSGMRSRGNLLPVEKRFCWDEKSSPEPFLRLLDALRQLNYQFVTPTPATHERVVSRPNRKQARDVRDVLGWSLPFSPEVIPPYLLQLLYDAGGILDRDDGLLNAAVRVSTVRGHLFLHSKYPTNDVDSVFLGPDSFRFAQLIMARSDPLRVGDSILDYGAGAGVGGIIAAAANPGTTVTLADVNPKALFLASINAEFAKVSFRVVQANDIDEVSGEYDLILANPPYMMDSERRVYRDGGDLYGTQLSLDWSLAGLRKLRPGGALILYTGVPIVDGRDPLLDQFRARLPASGWQWDYGELEPDVFGEELAQPAYSNVERIAAVGFKIKRAP